MLASMYIMEQDTIILRSFNCQQKLAFSQTPTSGSFKITVQGVTTSALAYNVSSASVKTALLNAGVDVLVTGSVASGFLITFRGCLSGLSIPKIIITDNTLVKSGVVVGITVTYTGNGRDELGVWVEGVVQDVTIKASVQPLSGKDYQLLLEGDRKKEAYEVYTKTAISNEQLIIFRNKTFEINKLEIWSGYYYAIITARRPV